MFMYAIFTFVNQVNSIYETALISKHVISYAQCKYTTDGTIIYIQDEIWEIIDKEELNIFYDFICV